MKLSYETSIATFIQFIIGSMFILITQLGSSAVTCFKNSADCVSNLITSLIFFIFVAIVFGFIWLVGFAAQDRRSKRLARFLICIEGFLALLALFSLKLNLHSRNVLGAVASFGMLVMSAWIISLAFRLMRSGGGRVMSRERQRQRHRRHEIS